MDKTRKKELKKQLMRLIKEKSELKNRASIKFRKINAGTVESDDGFSIQITGPEILKYRYKDYETTIDISYSFKKRKAYIYASDVSEWHQESKKIKMNENDKNIMIQNIKAALTLLDGDFDVL